MASVTADFDFYPRVLKSGESIRLIDKSYGTGEVVVSWEWTVDGVVVSTDPFPVITPGAVVSPESRNITLLVTGSAAFTSSKTIAFYTYVTESDKPLKSGTFDNISIFIYNDTNATVLNRNTTPNQGFLFTSLTFTESLNRAGTATFTVVNRGLATDTEKGLLKAETYVAIISGNSVVWSGKILRAEQNVLTLFNSTNASSMWDIECESDISKMRLQNIESTSIGAVSGSIGKVVSQLCDSTTDINWNGVHDLGLRSNEGPEITYIITDADMYSQVSTLRNVIDFDMRTRMVYQRYTFSYFSYSLGVYKFDLPSTSPYGVNDFLGQWVLVCGDKGVYVFGLCTSNGITDVSCTTLVNSGTVPYGGATGTIIVLGDPVLDIVSNVSQPSKKATFKMNTPLSSTYSSGYEFDDKTDKKLLATKVVAKGKNLGGATITSTVAAVTPWLSEKAQFEDTTVISKRTEGIIIAVENLTINTGYIYVEGWDFVASVGDYIAVKHPSDPAKFSEGVAATKIYGIVEMYSGSIRVTRFYLFDLSLITPDPSFVGSSIFIIKAADQVAKYGSIYVRSITDLDYVDAMNIYIGGETIETVDSVLDAVYGYRIRYLCDGTATHRDATLGSTGAHIPGSTVWKTYDESTPYPTSPVDYHGIILQTYTADQNVTLPTLEMYATMYLIAYSYYYRKAKFWCMVQDFFKTDFRVTELSCASYLSAGDCIACLPKSTDLETDLVDGQLKNIWQIVSWTLDANTMQVTVELGDFERNVFTLLADKTAAINQTIT